MPNAQCSSRTKPNSGIAEEQKGRRGHGWTAALRAGSWDREELRKYKLSAFVWLVFS